MFWKEANGFGDVPLSSKIGISLFLILAGVGYLLGFANIVLTYSDVDQEPGLSIADIRISFYGARDKTALESAIDGGMKQYFQSDKDYDTTKAWLTAGATEEEFDAKILPIFALSCNMCHSEVARVADVSTETYADVEPLLAQDTGKSVSRLVGLSHTHLLSTIVVLFILAMIFPAPGLSSP